ncbi:glycosyltransferase family 4 protein [Pseudooceanicola aestuarii]|uniref:glycosyltransferase family 4 protein n=1 Tax=Pseudooceanicola aestuarii TaxID=2697319 RepID=UPI001952EAFC|nr:glycosyltransferase family 4 protein [Pseudooceanicola aestuarii]
MAPQSSAEAQPLNVMLTVNAAWNVWNFRQPVLKALLSKGHRVTVLAPPDDSVEMLKEMGCRVLPLEMSAKGLNPLEGLRLRRAFLRAFRQERPDIVFSYTIKNNLFGAMAARRCGVPFLPNVTGLGTAFLSGGALQRVAETLYRHAFRPLPKVFFQNEDDRRLFLSRRLVREDQAEVLPGSGIDLEHFARAPYPEGKETRFLMIARLLRDKGAREYVEAARTLKAEGANARFQILGAPDSENRTAISREEVAEWEAEGIIDYLGTAPDVRPHIAEAHCIVLPSYREGAPRTLIEAAAMARPLIATDVPGCTAVVDHDANGFLCEVRSGASLAEACRRFLSMEASAQREMGLAGRAKMVAQYDEALIVAAYERATSEMTGRGF